MTGWQVDETSVGLAPHGLSCDSLPVYTGSSTPPPGTVISDVRIVTRLDLHLGDVTVERSCIRPTADSGFSGWEPVVTNTDYNTCCGPSAAQVWIRDSEIDGSMVSRKDIAGACGFHGVGVLERNFIHDVGSGICFRYTDNEHDAVAVNNYVTNLRAYGEPESTGSHNEAATVRDFPATRRSDRQVTFRGNRLVTASGNDSGSLFIQAIDGPIDNVVLADNLFQGRGYNLVVSPGAHAYGRNLRATNNRFDGGTYGPVQFAASEIGHGWRVWSENYLFNPAADDARGAVVPEP
ncbi:hypothetical protein JD79_00506 [Geodermatophilus normandii]|uniref:Right-handed parallel beta-helix repeat-containing protein n=1 Tax=Geodermatophilus normandii TaxID=1137989 RepID=A0A317QF59_9ACTN|nr:hypothetical protein [Geodermatophilus normandii]PWW21377.1 hypothetical protein JD79_00506 [Geodermatophilus normandii]